MAENPSSTLVITLPAKRGGEVAITGDYGELTDAADKLNQKGIIAVSDSTGGVLRLLVSGLKNPSQLNTLLGKQVTIKQSEGGKDSPSGTDSSIGEWIKHHTLRVAGMLYLIGDTTLFLSGVTGGKAKEAASGLLWAGGGITSTIYGDPTNNRQIKNVGNAMLDFMASQGVTPGKDTALYNLSQTRMPGWLKRVNGFLYNHPSEAHNAFYVVGSGTYFQSGMDKLRSSDPKQHAGWWQDLGVGTTVGTGALIGTFVKEKHKANGKKPSNPIEYMQEKPLRISGALYMLNNVFSLMSAFAERKEWKKAAALNPDAAAHDPQRFANVFKFITAGVMAVSNVFLSLSSRHNSELHTEHNSFKDDMIGGMAAEVIASQPEEKRAPLIDATAVFLSQRYETGQTQDAWGKILNDKVEALLANGRNTGNKDASNTVQTNLTSEETKQIPKTTTWQEKVNAATELPVTSQSL